MTLTTFTTDPTSAGRAPVGDIERNCWIAVVAATAVLGIVGFANSFERVNERMIPYFGHLAWTVPLAVDVGILIFTALDLLMAYRDIRSVWLRYVPRALIAVTIYLNVVGETAWEGRVAHAVLPAVWAIAVEVAGIAVRTIFGLKTERAQMDRVRRSRWLLAPVSTARLRRRMVLREETSLAEARSRDLAFELAKADLRDRYKPVLWRFRAPRRERLLLRRGEVAPATAEAPPEGATFPRKPHRWVEADEAETGTETGPETTPARPVPARRTNGGRSRTKAGDRTPARSWEELVPAAETVADQMATDGLPLTRRPFMDRMSTAGYPIGTGRAKPLIDHLNARATAGTNGTHPTATEPLGAGTN